MRLFLLEASLFQSHDGFLGALLLAGINTAAFIAHDSQQRQPPISTDVDSAFSELAAQHQVSIAIIQDGEVSKSIPFKDADTNDPLNEVMSITKSITALLAGIALEDNLIGSLDEAVSVRSPSLSKAPYAGTSLRQILQQISCFEPPALLSQEQRWKIGKKDMFHLLSLAEPSCVQGSSFFYSNVMPNVVSQVIEYATGESMEKYAKRKLFDPIGITDWRWQRDDSGHALAEAGLALTAFDLAKIGQLILQDGTWNRKKILAKQFIQELYQPSVNNANYSLLWWLHRMPSSSSSPEQQPLLLQGSGYAGQYLYIDRLHRRVTAILTRPQWAWDLCADRESEECYSDYVAVAERQQPIIDKIISAY